MTPMRHLNTRTRPSTRRWALDLNDDMNDLFGQMERLMLQPFGATRGFAATPYPIDLYETADAVVLEMAVPGLRPEQLDVSLEGRQLTIHGVLPDGEEGQEAERRSYWVRSIPRGEFQRTVTIPAGVDADAIEARVDQGMLTLTMPKAAEARARRIEVRNGFGTPELEASKAD
mgnify:CR=1 FL=1